VQTLKLNTDLGMVLDRALEMPVMMASTEGGMEIEEVAEKDSRENCTKLQLTLQ